MNEIIASLLTWLAANGPYDRPETYPEIEFLPASFFESTQCSDPTHCSTRAFYFQQTKTIALHAIYERTDDPRARAILVHELVHYLQDINGVPPAATCDEWVEREHEANRLQLQYLITETGNYHLHLPVPDRKQCEAATAVTTQRD